METRPPTVTRILVAIGFALSCFALALFLWIAFGGPLPLKPEGYRFTVPFNEATQLAVAVGRADLRRLRRQGEVDRPRRQRARRRVDRARQPVRADSRRHAGDPAPEDAARRDLRRAHPGRPERPAACRRAATLPEAQVADSVQLDEIFRTFNARTRQAFQVWMQGAAGGAARARRGPLGRDRRARAVRRADEPRCCAILDTPAATPSSELIRSGGDVFQALSERQGQLRGLIQNSDAVFATTARRNAGPRGPVPDPAHLPARVAR